MANIRGKNLNKDTFDVIVSMNPKRIIKDSNGTIKGRYLDIQIDQRDAKAADVTAGKVKVDSNPHLASVGVDVYRDGDGKYVKGDALPKDAAERDAKVASGELTKSGYTEHRVPYSEEQYQKMVAAAGDKTTKTKDGDILVGVHGHLQLTGKKQLILNTAKDMSPSTQSYFGPQTLARQEKITQAMKDVNKEARAKSKEAPIAEPAVEAEAQVEAEA